VLEPKEQAKYYIDKIRSTGKGTSQTLLIVVIPLLFLFINEVESKYKVAQTYISAKIHIDSLKTISASTNKQREAYSARIIHLRKKSVEKYNSKAERLKAVLDLKEREKPLRRKGNNIDSKISNLRRKSGKVNDSLKSNLIKLTIPVTLPILNVKMDAVNFRYIVMLIMILYTLLIWHLLLKRRIII
jgi:hypothetical protein